MAASLKKGDRVYLEFVLREGSNWAALGYVISAAGLEPMPALAALEDLRRELRIRRPWTLPVDMTRVRVFGMMDFPAATRYADELFESREYALAALAYEQARELNPCEPGTTSMFDHCTKRLHLCRRKKA